MLLPSPRPLLPCRPRTCVVWRPDKAPPPADDLAALLWEKAGVGEGGSPLKGSGTVGPKVDVVLRGERKGSGTGHRLRAGAGTAGGGGACRDEDRSVVVVVGDR